MSKTWFVTGTSTGFGRHLTEMLLQRGDRVAATLRAPSASMTWSRLTVTGCGCGP